jgi:hypothetical protein
VVRYNKSKIESEVLNFCKFPVPRTSVEIVRYLKARDLSFYPKTEASQVVKFLKRDILDDLVDSGLILRYNSKQPQFERARKLLAYYYSKQPNVSPRKVQLLYQANFLNLGEDNFFKTLPTFPEINLDVTALLYNLTKDKSFENFSFELINLIYCYLDPDNKDKIRLSLYTLDFTERERELIEKILEYNNIMQEFCNSIPMKPDVDRALDFLKSL